MVSDRHPGSGLINSNLPFFSLGLQQVNVILLCLSRGINLTIFILVYVDVYLHLTLILYVGCFLSQIAWPLGLFLGH